MVEDKEIKF